MGFTHGFEKGQFLKVQTLGRHFLDFIFKHFQEYGILFANQLSHECVRLFKQRAIDTLETQVGCIVTDIEKASTQRRVIRVYNLTKLSNLILTRCVYLVPSPWFEIG
jgi:hypothetical protein